MLETWTLAVLGLMKSRSAISPLPRPSSQEHQHLSLSGGQAEGSLLGVERHGDLRVRSRADHRGRARCARSAKLAGQSRGTQSVRDQHSPLPDGGGSLASSVTARQARLRQPPRGRTRRRRVGRSEVDGGLPAALPERPRPDRTLRARLAPRPGHPPRPLASAAGGARERREASTCSAASPTGPGLAVLPAPEGEVGAGARTEGEQVRDAGVRAPRAVRPARRRIDAACGSSASRAMPCQGGQSDRARQRASSARATVSQRRTSTGVDVVGEPLGVGKGAARASSVLPAPDREQRPHREQGDPSGAHGAAPEGLVHGQRWPRSSGPAGTGPGGRSAWRSEPNVRATP